MSDQRDYYEVLGVARDAEQKAIRDAFRGLALKYHPDRNKAPDAEARFKEIAEAYAVLSDPKKRADYDARGFAGVSGFSQEDLFGGINFEDIFGGLDFGFGAGSPFEAFFDRRPRGPQRGANIEVALAVTLERIAAGGEETVRLTRPAVCAACHGTGEEGGAARTPCEACGGTGQVSRSRRAEREQVVIRQITPCPVCHGRGSVVRHPCAQCGGSGETAQEESLTVKIPPGAKEGMALRLPGKGMPSPEAGAVAGDLYVVLSTRRDPRFERAGADLLREERVHLTDAVLGTTLEVPTLEGSVSVGVPAGTQPDAVLRLKGKGLPAFGGGPRGDLYLRIAVSIPEHLTRRERELYESLRELVVKPDSADRG